MTRGGTEGQFHPLTEHHSTGGRDLLTLAWLLAPKGIGFVYTGDAEDMHSFYDFLSWSPSSALPSEIFSLAVNLTC